MAPSVKKNYVYHLMFEILKIILPLITAPYITRVLEPDGTGIYGYTTANLTYFLLIAALGTSSYGTGEIARHRNDREKYSKLFWEIELLSVCTSIFALVLWGLFIAVTDKYKIYYLALTPALISNIFDISWFFTGQEQVKYIVVRNIIFKLLGVFCLFTFIKEKDDLLLYAIINSCITLLGSISMWTYLPKMLSKVDFRTLSISRHFKQTLVYFVPSIATSIYTVLDKTLIGLITGNPFQNGYYETATLVMNMVKTVVFVSVNAVLGARMSFLYSENKIDEIRERIHKSMDYIILLAIGCTFGLIGVSNSFVPAFFGDKYLPVIPMLNLMAPLVIIVGISNCIGSQYYTPSGNRAQSSRYLIYGSIINLVMNLLLIPKHNAQGAIIASVVAESVITVLYVANCKGIITTIELIKMLYKRVIAGTLMLFLIFAMDKYLAFSGYGKLFLEVIGGGSFYLLFLLVVFRDDMMKYLLNMALGYLKIGYEKTFGK